ncbi:nucleotidyltransferase domain-containing protein [Pyrobaculum sp.]|uniref:nucleotidyltransferase domain-containing protein n=1 Tax=Pyrobaculum sp. TaxID=2004705 RepID=UPI00315F9A24
MRPVYRIDVETALERIRPILSKRRLAVLFGSALYSQEVHDIDILIDGRDLEEALRLSAELELAIRAPADVVPLELAPPCLVAEALAKGVIITADPDYLDEAAYLAAGQCQDLLLKLREVGIIL